MTIKKTGPAMSFGKRLPCDGLPRVAGSILLREAYASPWAVAIPGHATLSPLLEADMDARVAAFRLVEPKNRS
jgi:hypothetical protein